jgi:hypothetical protein
LDGEEWREETRSSLSFKEPLQKFRIKFEFFTHLACPKHPQIQEATQINQMYSNLR